MKNKYEFQIKYYERVLKEDIAEYLKYLNNNKLPCHLDILNKEIDKIIKYIKKSVDNIQD